MKQLSLVFLILFPLIVQGMQRIPGRLFKAVSNSRSVLVATQIVRSQPLSSLRTPVMQKFPLLNASSSKISSLVKQREFGLWPKKQDFDIVVQKFIKDCKNEALLKEIENTIKEVPENALILLQELNKTYSHEIEAIPQKTKDSLSIILADHSLAAERSNLCNYKISEYFIGSSPKFFETVVAKAEVDSAYLPVLWYTLQESGKAAKLLEQKTKEKIVGLIANNILTLDKAVLGSYSVKKIVDEHSGIFIKALVQKTQEEPIPETFLHLLQQTASLNISSCKSLSQESTQVIAELIAYNILTINNALLKEYNIRQIVDAHATSFVKILIDKAQNDKAYEEPLLNSIASLSVSACKNLPEEMQAIITSLIADNLLKIENKILREYVIKHIIISNCDSLFKSKIAENLVQKNYDVSQIDSKLKILGYEYSEEGNDADIKTQLAEPSKNYSQKSFSPASPSESKIVIGGEIPEDLQEILEFYTNRAAYDAIGAKRPKGALLEGPPGCGKTHLVRWIAQETKAKLLHSSGSDFDEKYVGVGASRIRELFKAAEESGPAIVFIDEIDAIGGKRDDADNRVHHDTLNALLTIMDGFKPNNTLVLAATNLIKSLDSALTRPGRFDRIITISLPNETTRKAILIAHAQQVKNVLSEEDFALLAQQTQGFSAAYLASLVNEAAILAVRSQSEHLKLEAKVELKHCLIIVEKLRKRMQTIKS